MRWSTDDHAEKKPLPEVVQNVVAAQELVAVFCTEHVWYWKFCGSRFVCAARSDRANIFEKSIETVTGIMTNWGFTIPAGGHDNEDRLVNWQRNNGIDNQQWNLSLVADWTDTTINGSQELRTHDDAHELTARGAQTITYDPKGNIAQQPHSGVAQNYTWDYDNKLASADTTGDGTADVTYTFDALGRRVSKTTPGSGIAIVYVCLGDQEIAEYSFTPVTTTTTGSVGAITPKTVTYTLALLRDYIYASYVDEPIAMVVPNPQPLAPSIYYYHQTSQFNTVALSDINGNIVERYAYDAYGKPHIFDGSGNPRVVSLYGNAYLYTGRRYDAEIQLYYFRGRMYDAELGRFPNRDPAEYPDGYNLYAGYFGMWGGTDPWGESTITVHSATKTKGYYQVPQLPNTPKGNPVYGQAAYGWKLEVQRGSPDKNGYSKITAVNLTIETAVTMDARVESMPNEEQNGIEGHELKHIEKFEEELNKPENQEKLTKILQQAERDLGGLNTKNTYDLTGNLSNTKRDIRNLMKKIEQDGFKHFAKNDPSSTGHP